MKFLITFSLVSRAILFNKKRRERARDLQHCNSRFPALILPSEILRKQQGLLVNQRLKGLMLPVSNPLNLNHRFEEVV